MKYTDAIDVIYYHVQNSSTSKVQSLSQVCWKSCSVHFAMNNTCKKIGIFKFDVNRIMLLDSPIFPLKVIGRE